MPRVTSCTRLLACAFESAASACHLHLATRVHFSVRYGRRGRQTGAELIWISRYRSTNSCTSVIARCMTRNLDANRADNIRDYLSENRLRVLQRYPAEPSLQVKNALHCIHSLYRCVWVWTTLLDQLKTSGLYEHLNDPDSSSLHGLPKEKHARDANRPSVVF